MPNYCIDPSDLNIPAFDTDSKTFTITLNIHPGQAQILDHLARSPSFGFVNTENAARFCICWGIHTLLGPLPPSFRFAEAKLNTLQYERLQRQRDIVAESVQKYLARGEHELARRTVSLAYEDYRSIAVEYWRDLWLATLEPAVEMFKQHGIRIPAMNLLRKEQER